MHAGVGQHVPLSTMDKIVSGQYVELASLLNREVGHCRDERKFSINAKCELVLATGQTGSKRIYNIDE